MNSRQLEVMEMKLHPGLKLALISMIQHPELGRKGIAEFMRVDQTQLSSTAKKLKALGLLKVKRVDDSSEVRYEVLV